MNILIAEDNRIQRHWLKETLTAWGHDVVATCDGEQAWQSLSREDAPRLVILDWIMPGLNGIEVCQKFRETYPSRPTHIILLTGEKKSKENLIEGLNAGADDYLTKPVDQGELHARIQSGIRVLELQGSLVTHTQELEREIAERKRAETALQEAEQSLQRRNKELTALNTVAQAMGTTLQLDTLLECVLDGLQQVIPYDTASINMLHTANAPYNGGHGNDAPIAMPVASRGIEHPAPRGLVLDKQPLVQQVVRQGSPIIFPGTHKDEMGAIPVQSWLGVPLISKEKVSGVMLIGSHRPGAYDEDTAHLALAFSHQVALAIENSRLYGQTRAQLRETILLHSVTAALSSTLDLGQMLPYVARSLCEALNSTSVEIYQPDADHDAITVIAGYVSTQARDGIETEPRSTLGQTCALSDFPAAAEILDRNRPRQMQIDDPNIDPRDRANLQAHDAQAMLLLPMVAHGQTLGLAAVWESQAPRRFTQGETATGQTLTHHAAIAMDHARLFVETQRQVNELQLLHNVSLAAASGIRLEDALQAAADALASALPDTRVAIMLLDPQTDTLSTEASVGYPDATIEHLYLKLGEGISGWVALHGKPVIVPDVRLDPRYCKVIADVRSELCVPLTAGPFIIGILNVASPRIDDFTDEDLRLLNTLAGNLAVLVERVRLFTQVEEAKIELQDRAEALEQANARLQELDQFKDQFLANMSHELRTPLNSIIGYSDVLLHGMVGEISDSQKKCVQDILTSGQHLMAVINDVLDLSKIEAGHMALELKSFEIAELLEDVHATISPLIEKKSQTLIVEQSHDLRTLTADRFRIKQVLLNLLSNANKFTPDEGTITISCRQTDAATALFSVTDTGVGIKPEEQEIIFEKFRQVGDSAAQKAIGTGLGLNISKRLVEMHGGRIWAESEYGHGTTLSFELPLVALAE